MFIFLRLVPIKKAIFTLISLVLLVGITFSVLQRTGGIPGTAFLTDEIDRYAGGLSIRSIVNNSGHMVDDYIRVLDINQTGQKWDKFHYYFKDRYAYWFLLHSGWWDLYPYKKEINPFPELRQKAMRIYTKSYVEPWVWLTWNPLWLLALPPLAVILFYFFPQTAIFSMVILAGALPLIYLRIFNWRYYYFFYLGLLFIVPMMMSDLFSRKSRA
jgi:hypothetical protein